MSSALWYLLGLVTPAIAFGALWCGATLFDWAHLSCPVLRSDIPRRWRIGVGRWGVIVMSPWSRRFLTAGVRDVWTIRWLVGGAPPAPPPRAVRPVHRRGGDAA